MATPAVLLYAPDGMQYQRYAGSRGSGRYLGRTNPVAGDGPGASGSDSLQRYPFGTQMVLQDGRKFRFAVAGGTLLVVGDLVQAAANVANHVGIAGVATALGSRTPQATLGATAATADQYAGGYAAVDLTPDVANVYAIESHDAAGSAAVITLNLAAGHAIRTSAWTTTTDVGLIKHPQDSVIQAIITTITGVIAGVVITPLAAYATTGAALAFGWLQTHGIAVVTTSGTLVLGNNAGALVAAAGAVGPNAAATTANVGWVQKVHAGHGTVFLRIDG